MQVAPSGQELHDTAPPKLYSVAAHACGGEDVEEQKNPFGQNAQLVAP